MFLKKIKKTFLNIIKDKKGYLSVESAIFYLFLLYTFIRFYSLPFQFYWQYELNIFANELSRTVEIYGNVGAEVENRYKELVEKLKIAPEVEYSTIGDLDFKEKFIITLKLEVSPPFSNDTLTLTRVVDGVSETYRKSG